MKNLGIFLFAVFFSGCAFAGMPQPKTVKAIWDPYEKAAGTSNLVFTLYKSTWLGTVATPWKKTAIAVWPRTNVTCLAMPGICYFRVTLTSAPYGESAPSNTITNLVQ